MNLVRNDDSVMCMDCHDDNMQETRIDQAEDLIMGSTTLPCDKCGKDGHDAQLELQP